MALMRIGGDTSGEGNGTWMPWLVLAVGLAALYVPTYVNLANTIWGEDEQSHGPLILMIVFWLVWTKRAELSESIAAKSHPILGACFLLFGALCYVIGRSQDVLLLDVGSQLPVLLGVLLIIGGWRAVRVLWFPLLFLVFLVPVPGIILDALTGSLKQGVSQVAEAVLHMLGYPIARSGVVLTIGPYQLMVADACSGMHSLYSLSALGILYLYLMQHPQRARNLILLSLIVPIALAANVVRVLVLVLVTYHLGDEAGQGFLHGFAGMVLFVAALMILFLADTLIGFAFRGRQHQPGDSPASAPAIAGGRS